MSDNTLKTTRKRKYRGFWRAVQIVTGIHRIHHIVWSYGYKLPLVNIGYFHYRDTGFKRLKGRGEDYHNCTKSGIY